MPARLILPLLALVALLSVAAPARADEPTIMAPPASLLQAPKTHPAEGFTAEGCESLFFESVPYKGKPTKVFAWLGLPKRSPEDVAAGKKVPGIVLVHGGGGTAFDAWVRLWTGRGYAAIAMDTTGTTPRGSYGKWERHAAGGPPGNNLATINEPVEDQWQYHAVSSVMLAHSLLRSRPEVDVDRIGLTGISWGGYLTCVVSGLDDRFKFAVPVYGTGYLGDDSLLSAQIAASGDAGRKWLAIWDPSLYLKKSRTPTLFVTGTNDFAFSLDSLKRSQGACLGPASTCVRLRMPHGHNGPGENPQEIHVFAESIVGGGRPLPSPIENNRDGDQVRYTFDPAVKIVKAELLYTAAADGRWKDREWKAVHAEVDAAANAVVGKIPAEAKSYFVNVYDDRDCVRSTAMLSVDEQGEWK